MNPEAVAAGGPMPFDGFAFARTYGRPTDPLPFTSRATFQSVFPGCLGITRTALCAGRDFTMDDLINERPVVIVDERMATQLWPDGAIGHAGIFRLKAEATEHEGGSHRI